MFFDNVFYNELFVDGFDWVDDDASPAAVRDTSRAYSLGHLEADPDMAEYNELCELGSSLRTR